MNDYAVCAALRAAADKIDSLKAELAVIDTLPKTVDGAPITLGSAVWVRHNDGSVEECFVQAIWCKKVLWAKPDSQGYEGAHISVCYNTREAAEQATQKGGDA